MFYTDECNEIPLQLSYYTLQKRSSVQFSPQETLLNNNYGCAHNYKPFKKSCIQENLYFMFENKTA